MDDFRGAFGETGAMSDLDLDHPVFDAVLSAAATLLNMEVVFLGGLTDDTFTFEKVHAVHDWPGLVEGKSTDRTDSFCHRLLEGAPPHTADAAHDPHYQDAPVRRELGIQSYVGVPVRNEEGVAVATLCGIDRNGVAVSDEAVRVLRQLAEIVSAQLGPLAADQVVIRQQPSGRWEVSGKTTEDLTSAMVLADLLAAEISPSSRPERSEKPLDELGQLRLSVQQLEHALAARVVVEQAIGVLTERQSGTPREAFERLRKVARSRGRKVHELATEVVASATDHSVPLPPELSDSR